MRRPGLALVLALLASACGLDSAPPSASSGRGTTSPPSGAEPGAASSGASVDKIVVIVMENNPFDAIVGNPGLPFINGTITKSSIALTDMHSDSAPSLPNYVWMAAGSACGAQGSDTAWDRMCPSLFDQLQARGIPWVVYAEGYAGTGSSCFTGEFAGAYARKHVPPLLFSSSSAGPACTEHIRNFPGEATGANGPPARSFAGVSLPAVTLIIPGLCHDMHNSAAECGAAGGGQAGGDRWLSLNWADLVRAAGSTGTIVLTWDESDTSDGHIATFIGGAAIGGAAGATDGHHYDHSSTLRAIEDMLGLPCLAGACAARSLPISGRAG